MSTTNHVSAGTRLNLAAEFKKVSLADVDILAELKTRPCRLPHYEDEHRAFSMLTEQMVEDPGHLLQKLVEIAADVCGADSAGISVLDGDVFRWQAVAGVFASARGGTMPRAESPCGVCIDRNTTQLMHLPDRCFPALQAEPRFVEALLVPFHDQVKPIGTVWIVSHRAEKCFDREDERVVRHLAQFASAICWALARPAPRSNGGPPHDRAVDVPAMSAPSVVPGEGMRRVMNMVHRVSDSNVSVLLTGETGAGKEVIARELHRRSDRRSKEFVKVNCAALPAELLESELFGYERGAFTGAQMRRIGKFEFAHQGTIFLDEIGEVPLGLQAKLLHVLQDGAFTRLGTNRTTHVDVRVIAATNRDLVTMIRTGQFREDLYYRLQVIEISVPPLRARRDEIDGLVDHFMRLYAQEFGKPALEISVELRDALNGHAWPGNVRELQNTVKRFVILQDESLILDELQRRSVGGLSPGSVNPMTVGASVASAGVPRVDAGVAGNGSRRVAGRLPDVVRAATLRAEREVIQDALDHFRWNRRKAAQQLGVSYRTLRSKMKSCGLKAPPAEVGQEKS